MKTRDNTTGRWLFLGGTAAIAAALWFAIVGAPQGTTAAARGDDARGIASVVVRERGDDDEGWYVLTAPSPAGTAPAAPQPALRTRAS